MNVKRIAALFSVVISLVAQAEPFEIYGLKSGMTKAEYYELTNCQAFVDNFNAKKSRYQDAKDLTACLDVPKTFGSEHAEYGHESMAYFDGIGPDLGLSWTHDDRLWRVQIQETVPSGILQEIGFRRAFQDAFPALEVQESSSTSQYGTTEYLTVMFIDSDLSEVSVEHYQAEYLKKLNNKK